MGVLRSFWARRIRVRHGASILRPVRLHDVRAHEREAMVSEKNSRLSAFEARLAQLRKNMEAGLGERAGKIEAHARQLTTAASDAREGLRHEAHKLRGIAGTFGHLALGELAGALEQVALDAPSDRVARLAQQLVEAVQKAGITVASLPPVAAVAVSVPPEPIALEQVQRVLAVDDDLETRKLLELTLSHLGDFHTTLAKDGTEALALLSRETFNLVLCDAMMPDMNGLTFCERAALLDMTDHLPPIVILSAATSEELGWNVEVGHAPAAWWRKPFRPKELIVAVRQLLAESQVR